MNPDLVASIITALVSLILGLLSFASAGRATRASREDEKPEAEAEAGQDAYSRAAGVLETALARCEEENARLRAELASLPSRRPAQPGD